MPAAMILRNFKRKGTLLAQIRGIAEQSLEISSKTHMFLKGLPNSATEQGLKDALKDIKYRRLSIEPGCTFHVSSESAACVGSQLFKEKHNLKVCFLRKFRCLILLRQTFQHLPFHLSS